MTMKTIVEKENKCDFLFEISLPGRIIMILYTFHGLFFIYNLFIQYIILFLVFCIQLRYDLFLNIFFQLYIIFKKSSSNILLIPTF